MANLREEIAAELLRQSGIRTVTNEYMAAALYADADKIVAIVSRHVRLTPQELNDDSPQAPGA